ncbi:hypothetical protein HanRHA438_Chr12g0541231 [Helianthus annuus]|nr:hypothetical protein HanRHA438_Chr12g0541231 [Helianthus annuus]
MWRLGLKFTTQYNVQEHVCVCCVCVDTHKREKEGFSNKPKSKKLMMKIEDKSCKNEELASSNLKRRMVSCRM